MPDDQRKNEDAAPATIAHEAEQARTLATCLKQAAHHERAQRASIEKFHAALAAVPDSAPEIFDR